MRLSVPGFAFWVRSTPDAEKNVLSGIRLCILQRALIASGNANNGANAGFVYSNSNNTASNTNANIGSQLSLKKDKMQTLHLQVEVDGEKKVIFTGSDVLISMIKKVEQEDMPFKTIIIKENEHFEFT